MHGKHGIEINKDNYMNALYDTHYDLIVVGGGIAGSMAATAAGREGLSVLLIEEEGFLGGKSHCRRNGSHDDIPCRRDPGGSWSA